MTLHQALEVLNLSLRMAANLIRICFNYVSVSIVFIGFSSVHAGAYEDFFRAVRNDDVRTVRQLLLRGFDANTLDPQKRSGLLIAADEVSPKVAQLLISTLGIDINRVNAKDENALMLAALRGQENMVKSLIERGAEVNKPGWAPLHYAATSGHAGIVRLLLEHHAFVDTESPNGTTPLMMAAQYGSTEALKLLLAEGAVASARNKLGKTALDFAHLGSRPDAIAILTEAMRAEQTSGPSAPQSQPMR